MTALPLTILGLGAGVPTQKVTNDDLSARMDTSDEWIRERTGILSRYILPGDKATSHLAIEAGEQALLEAGLSADIIDLVLVATMTPDTFMPATACRVAHALGCHQAGALDLNVACSGFLYGLITSAAQLASHRARHILCIGGDTVSRLTDWNDRRTAVLFGDAAGAAILSGDGNGELLGWDFGADGNSAASLSIKAGPGLPSDDPIDYKVSMDGKAVFRFAAAAFVASSERALTMAGVGLEQVDVIVPHQANRRILEIAAKRWGLDPRRLVVNLDRYGNTSAGSVPLALLEAHRDGRIRPGNIILLSAFGGGLSWASAVLRW